MFPGIYEFHWDTGHIIFMGALYTVLSLMGLTMLAITIRVIKNFRANKVEAIMWREDFHDLPAAATRCRFEVTGKVPSRACSGGFDCRSCDFKSQMEIRETAAASDAAITGVLPTTGDNCFGYEMPADRLYHRGHTWVQEQEDGTYLIGLDDFGKRLIGHPDRLSIPPMGSELKVNGIGWEMYNGGERVRVLSPLEGKVVAVGSADLDYYLRVRPSQKNPNLNHLLSGDDIRPWMLRELERLQGILMPEMAGMSLADGGAPVEDLRENFYTADWESVWGEIFLEG
jgi:Glycine cleavage H-protein